MKRTLMLIAIATLTVFGQKIETQKADRMKITRLATTQNHLSVLEFNEPVKEVAVGSSNFKVEWRENKVFIQPLEPDATTNLFIWTASGRQSYELVPAASVEEMHFAIDEEPPSFGEEGRSCRQPPSSTAQGARRHADGKHAGQDGRFLEKPPKSRDHRCRTSTGRTDGSTFGMQSSNGGRTVYFPAAPDVSL